MRTDRKHVAVALTGLTLLVGSTATEAALVNLGPGSFTALAPVIDFAGPTGIAAPVYNFVGLPTLGNVTVSFGQQFVGQVAGGGFPVTLTDTTPAAGPLALDAGTKNNVSTVNDAAPGATSPVLSGSPIFNGPISILFSVPVAAVGLKGGFFDAIGATTIQAYGVNGEVLGSIVNSVTGFEFYGLADSGGQNVIAGISFYITGNEPAGFQIDNVTFGAADVLNPVVPEPGSIALMGLGLAALAAYRARRQ